MFGYHIKPLSRVWVPQTSAQLHKRVQEALRNVLYTINFNALDEVAGTFYEAEDCSFYFLCFHETKGRVITYIHTFTCIPIPAIREDDTDNKRRRYLMSIGRDVCILAH